MAERHSSRELRDRIFNHRHRGGKGREKRRGRGGQSGEKEREERTGSRERVYTPRACPVLPLPKLYLLDLPQNSATHW